MSHHINDCHLGDNWLDCPACVEGFNSTCSPKEVMDVPDYPDMYGEGYDISESEFEALTNAINSDLGVEILWSAMLYLKDKPEEGIADAIIHGFTEWDAE